MCGYTLSWQTPELLCVLSLHTGDDHTGYNIPEVRACPEVGDFLSQSEEELAHIDLSQVSGLVRRLLCDSFICLYQSSR